MWVSRKDSWHSEIKPLEKFLAERIIQRCDYEEYISKKHRTTNGYVQLKELIKFCELSFKRNRTIKSLEVLIEESRSKSIKQNIVDDFIISNYFKDLKEYVQKIDLADLKISNTDAINLGGIKKLLHDLQKFEAQIEKYYFSSLKQEINLINFDEEEKIHRYTSQISILVDLLIPFLIFNGYSISSLNEVLRKWLGKPYRVTASRLLNFFNFQKKTFEFLIRINGKTSELDDFILILKDTVSDFEIKKASKIDNNFTRRYSIPKTVEFVSYKFDCFDPNAHIRDQYDQIIKLMVTHKERESLAMFNNHFENCFWSNTNNRKRYYHKASVIGDPISIQERRSTLRKSLVYLSNTSTKFEFNFNSNIPITNDEQVQKALYYYNLALKSKSIENSFSLLWTSLETILPYRIYGSDIECIKHVTAKTLAMGSLCRDVGAFVTRFKTLNKQNDSFLDSISFQSDIKSYSNQGVKEWYNWLTDENSCKLKSTTTSECSILLGFEHYSLSKPLIEDDLNFLKNRILSSKESIEFQLQRIYLHRNQIVHAGHLVNEYTNLWLHLEWYVGKLLYYSIFKLQIDSNGLALENIFREIEADFDYLMSYVERNPKKKIKDSKRVIDTLLEYNWQAY